MTAGFFTRSGKAGRAMALAMALSALTLAPQAEAREILPAGQDFSELAEQLVPAVVNITVGRSAGGAKGSGFIISKDGHVVTNHHVIQGANLITVQLDDGRELAARLVAADKATDIAVLKMTGSNFPFVTFGDSDEAKIGNWVLAVGNPFGFGGTVTMGIISARNRELQGPYDDYIQTDAAINSGNSGGPLFNMRGEVIGVNTAIISPSGTSSGIGLSVPSSLVEMTVSDLIKHGEVRRGWLGVNLQPVTPILAQNLGLDRPQGAYISQVDSTGPAAAAGIQSGDVILTFDKRPIPTLRALPKAVAVTPIGKVVDVEVWRDAQKLVLSAKVGSRNAPQRVSWLREPGEALSGAIGARLAEIDNELRDELGLDSHVMGLLVLSVDEKSPAEGRIQVGDVITSVDHRPVTELLDVAAKIKSLGEPEAVLMSVLRGGKTLHEAVPVNGKALKN